MTCNSCGVEGRGLCGACRMYLRCPIERLYQIKPDLELVMDDGPEKPEHLPEAGGCELISDRQRIMKSEVLDLVKNSFHPGQLFSVDDLEIGNGCSVAVYAHLRQLQKDGLLFKPKRGYFAYKEAIVVIAANR